MRQIMCRPPLWSVVGKRGGSTPEDKENILHSFVRSHEGRAPSGAGPSSGVVSFGKGDLYGTTSGGGNYNCKGGCGVVFRVGR
jgi:uncharacterized repeat protein (TIGR03803 family)